MTDSPLMATYPPPPVTFVRGEGSWLFDDLDRRYPGLRFRVVDEQGRLRPNMRLFVNGAGVRDLRHVLRPQDFVAVVLALSGG